jgi:chromosomal replication initiation ATPase DnaA
MDTDPVLKQAQRSFETNHQQITQVVTEVFECDPFKKTREQPYIFARHFLAYFLYQHTRMNMNQIAKYVGKRDHSSIHNSLKQARRLIDTDEYFTNKAKLITKLLSDIPK